MADTGVEAAKRSLQVVRKCIPKPERILQPECRKDGVLTFYWIGGGFYVHPDLTVTNYLGTQLDTHVLLEALIAMRKE